MDFTTLGKTAIREDAPCGGEARYEPEYELVQAEIDKLSSPTASGQVDWVRVAENSALILKNKSKDLTIAGYLAVALVCTRQIDGMDDGVRVLHDLLAAHWEGLYPPLRRMRGRAAAIQWWLERSETELQKLNPPPLPAEKVERIKTHLQGIDALLAEKMPDAPLLRALQRRVDGFAVQKAAAAAQPAAAQAPVAPGPSAPASPLAAATPAPADDAMSAAITDEAQARRAADAAFQRLRQTSLFHLQNDLKSPLSYRYRRIAGWAKVTDPPPNADGTTQIVPPPPQVVDAIATLRAEGHWAALIQNAEQKFSQYIFWLDLNRYVAEALNDLGADHQPARTAVGHETAGLLQRLPGLENLRFSDGMPFADAQTQAWLKSIRSSGQAGPESAGEAPAGATDEGSLRPVVEKARTLARKKNLVEAVALLQQQMQQSAGHGLKMRWRLAIANVLLESKKAQMALPHLEQILADIDAFDLERWDPALALEGLTAAWQGFSAQSAGEHKSRAMDLLHRLAKVDPTAALRLGG
ncbi:MAG: type VI secretion system protein TssA [Desulfatitalea sp.]